MKFRRARKFRAQLDLVPLIDVVFLLLIFFMVTTTFISVEHQLKVKLPSADTGKGTAAKNLCITLAGDGTILLGDSVTSLSELMDGISRELQKTQDGTVLIKADKSARHGLVVQIMDIAKKAGAEKLAIAATRDEG
ncbi:MAG: biopolymer transporter ExbD [Candidatus Wallbacteria bacterium HGW-Wallbacteria-1]|jgi:biopolymer transport protein ExbD|uniref:Biopolymer transporter ExbD n=1 Tax=Candidatus Wallbacteria bacterium HGW-Wallbacteria-1 TaxID=2013854 RepID=A0A2N1PJS3_9BACT|nr:MAG: biopolymer transporter ExbD [Candidatus Wallbacteria bacterium HGW-Wallbacteria-1]